MTEEFPLPEYWKLRAQESRLLAVHMHSSQCRKTLLEIAAAYERLVEAAMRLRRYTHLGIDGVASSN